MDTRTAWHPVGQRCLPSYDPRHVAAAAPQSGGVVVRVSTAGKKATKRSSVRCSSCCCSLCTCVSPLGLLCAAFYTFLQAWLLVAAGTLACELGEACWPRTECELLSVSTEPTSDGANGTTAYALVAFEPGEGASVTQVAFSSVDGAASAGDAAARRAMALSTGARVPCSYNPLLVHDCTRAVACDTGLLSPVSWAGPLQCCGYHVVLGETDDYPAPDTSRGLASLVVALTLVLGASWVCLTVCNRILVAPLRAKARVLFSQL